MTAAPGPTRSPIDAWRDPLNREIFRARETPEAQPRSRFSCGWETYEDLKHNELLRAARAVLRDPEDPDALIELDKIVRAYD